MASSNSSFPRFSRISLFLLILAGVSVVVLALDSLGFTRHTLGNGRRRTSDVLPHDADPVPPTPIEDGPPRFSLGTLAPTFTLLEARTGKRVSLDDYRGKRPVVLLLSSFG
jgi:hypothetical protein